MYDEYMITTFDNPFDPFEEFDKWFEFDTEKGYYSCNRLARIVKLENDMTELETNVAIEAAIDLLIKYDFLNIFKKVKKEAKND